MIKLYVIVWRLLQTCNVENDWKGVKFSHNFGRVASNSRDLFPSVISSVLPNSELSHRCDILLASERVGL